MKFKVYNVGDVNPNLFPITLTRPMGDLRLGVSTMAERWQFFLRRDYDWDAPDYLAELFPATEAITHDTLFVAGNVVATADIATAALALKPGQRLVAGDVEIAHRGTNISDDVQFCGDVLAVRTLYDIFMLNDQVLRMDFERLTDGRTSQQLHPSNVLLGDPAHLFIEEGAKIRCSSINVEEGPIYIGRDAVVMEGCRLRGSLALCEHAQLNMGALVYGGTTIGPHCKVGGEINNVVMWGYSNKAHDGFLGNAVIGQWCNLGAGTTASNLKNNYAKVRVWNYPSGRFIDTGLQFCGLIMGDHSKAAINTSFNTGTVVGIGCNVISEGFPPTFIPSFSRGGSGGFLDIHLDDFYTVAERVMARRHCTLTDAHRRLFNHIAAYADCFK